MTDRSAYVHPATGLRFSSDSCRTLRERFLSLKEKTPLKPNVRLTLKGKKNPPKKETQAPVGLLMTGWIFLTADL